MVCNKLGGDSGRARLSALLSMLTLSAAFLSGGSADDSRSARLVPHSSGAASSRAALRSSAGRKKIDFTPGYQFLYGIWYKG